MCYNFGSLISTNKSMKSVDKLKVRTFTKMNRETSVMDERRLKTLKKHHCLKKRMEEELNSYEKTKTKRVDFGNLDVENEKNKQTKQCSAHKSRI